MRAEEGKGGAMAMLAALSVAVFSHACDGPDAPPAVPDADTPDANVVVKVGQCTGSLVTPRIVLTASHCINGAEKPAGPEAVPCVGDKTPYVSVGPAWLEPDAVIESITSVTKVEECQPTDRSGEDLALVYLIDPVTQDAGRGSWSVPRVVRPSLVAPSRNRDNFDEGVAFSGYSPWDDDYKTWVFSTRRIQPLTNVRIDHEEQNGGATFNFDLPSGVHAGDSGGPLFAERSDGSRDPIGVLSQARGQICYLSDITWPSNKQWLLDHVTERRVAAMAKSGILPAYAAHTSKWLERHGKTQDDWWGELDQSGPCDTVHDADCDGWWDQPDAAHPLHDNCPTIPNPSQIDSDDDGIGDACSPLDQSSPVSLVSTTSPTTR